MSERSGVKHFYGRSTMARFLLDVLFPTQALSNINRLLRRSIALFQVRLKIQWTIFWAKATKRGMTLKAGCGIGYEFSTLRPKGAYVSGAGAYTSGPLSFMEIYDKMCFTVSSAGGRRGAQMATFDVNHPDVMDFILAKRKDGCLRQFNLSLLITSEFIEAVKNDGMWKLSFPMTEQEAKEIDLEDPEKTIWRIFPGYGQI